ncbi:RhuM family protein [Nocardioides sp. AE5]|uniref:RhuM family protein n=1 Tax=Nocardioides sp. AE5 TaxID=2962573 RepID=UPI00288151E4|nr:RhuM family protein [Nocardioides sp. AE5]MDT0200453.1 RhuM family protein [Nocardioides sp. AE5]
MSVGHRVKSPDGVHFRRWANTVLREYLIRGAVTNEKSSNRPAGSSRSCPARPTTWFPESPTS